MICDCGRTVLRGLLDECAEPECAARYLDDDARFREDR